MSGAIFFTNGKEITYEEVQRALSKLKPEQKEMIRRVHLRQDMGIIFVPSDKLVNFLEQVRYININEQHFKVIHNMSPTYYNGIGKIISINSPFVVKKFMIRNGIDDDEILKIVQIKNRRTIKGITKLPSYLIWIRGIVAIKKTLLMILPLIKEEKKH